MTSATTLTDPRTVPGRGGIGGHLRGEWTKLWSVRATWWSLVAALALQALTAASIGASFATGALGQGGLLPLEQAGSAGLQLAQLALVGLAMLAATTEFSTGSIVPSLQAVPRRWQLVTAKVVVVGGVGAVAGALVVAVGAATGWLAAGVVNHGGLAWVLADPWAGVEATGLTRMTLLGGAYGLLLSVFTVGVATLLRSAVASMLTVIALVLVVPGILADVSLEWVVAIGEHLPGGAAAAVLGEGPYGTGRGLAVLAAWAVGAVAAGTVSLHRRDA